MISALAVPPIFDEGDGVPTSSDQDATVQPVGCTLRAYADAKQLPEDLLRGLGLSDIWYLGARALRVPYFDAKGNNPAVRIRLALEKDKAGDNRFRWKQGSKPFLYGLWRLRAEQSVTVLEGESDCHTLWFHGTNAIGLPGAGLWDEGRDARYLADFETIYVLIEPDAGGEAMLQWVSNSALREKIRLVHLDRFKDPSDMHLADPEQFLARWQAAIKAAVPWGSESRARVQHARDQAWDRCNELATAPDILSLVASALQRAGLVGVEREVKLLYLVATSRLLDRPASVAVKGPSAGGKTYLCQMTLSLFPSGAFYAVTAMSERALAYGTEPLKHRMLVLYEADGMAGEVTSYLVRSLLSEGHIRYETVEKTPQGLRSRLIEREGPTGLIVTTTRDSLHPENETRLISLTIADGPEQTRAILKSLAEEDQYDSVDRAPWIALQEWIAASGTIATVPYARELVEQIPHVAIRLRRDIKLLLNLIRAHALLHQARRERDPQGRVVATIDDYAVVYSLVGDLMAEGAQTTVPVHVRETVEKVRHIACMKGSATVQDVATALGLDKSAASRRCTTASERGYIRNEEPSKGRPAHYVPADPLPEEQSLLPHPSTLAPHLVSSQATRRNYTIAAQIEGDIGPPLLTSAAPGLRRRVVL
jgi:hypothetical protein